MKSDEWGRYMHVTNVCIHNKNKTEVKKLSRYLFYNCMCHIVTLLTVVRFCKRLHWLALIYSKVSLDDYKLYLGTACAILTCFLHEKMAYQFQLKILIPVRVMTHIHSVLSRG